MKEGPKEGGGGESANSERERPSAGEETLRRAFAAPEKGRGVKGDPGQQEERQKDTEPRKGWPWDRQIRRGPGTQRQPVGLRERKGRARKAGGRREAGEPLSSF